MCITLCRCHCIYIVYRLFFGDTVYGLNIETIRIMEDKSNLEMIIQAITTLDRSLSWDKLSDYNYKFLNRKSKHGSLLVELFNAVMNNNNTKIQFNQYILNTFNYFRKSKTKIIFNFSGWEKLDWKDKRSRLVLFDFLDGKYDENEYVENNKDEIVDEDNMEIEFNRDLLQIFPNVTEIVIDWYPPKFSLSHFLSVIKGISSVKITDNKWIFRYSESLKQKIINEYRNHGLNISFKGFGWVNIVGMI